VRALADPEKLTGRSGEQVDRFLEHRIEPILEAAGAREPALELRV
jgi:hypothetical protein